MRDYTDIVPFDLYLLRPMASGMANQNLHSYEDNSTWIDSWTALKDEPSYRDDVWALQERWEHIDASDGQYFGWFSFIHFSQQIGDF